MDQHYSTADFFRRTPNALLERYFAEHDLFTDLNIAEMKETKVASLFDNWLKLPAERRNPIEAELSEIHGLSNAKGFQAIIDEANWHMQGEQDDLDAFVAKLSTLPNHYHRAMTIFLDHPEYWKGATRFSHADGLSYWRKRKNIGYNEAAVHDTDRQLLAKAIRTYFHLTEGRGNHCLVEAFRRDDLDYFFAYPEDHSQQSVEWVDGKWICCCPNLRE